MEDTTIPNDNTGMHIAFLKTHDVSNSGEPIEVSFEVARERLVNEIAEAGKCREMQVGGGAIGQGRYGVLVFGDATGLDKFASVISVQHDVTALTF